MFVQVKARAMNDPEVQQIMSDPAMRMILEQMQSDPQAVQVTSPHSVIVKEDKK